MTITNGHLLTTTSGIINNGTLNITNAGAATDLRFTGSQTFGGTGEIVMGGTSTTSRLYGEANNNVLTNGAGHTIRGSGQLLVDIGGLINNGTIKQQGGLALTVDPDASVSVTNNGLMRAEGTGGIILAAGKYFNAGAVEVAAGSSLTQQAAAQYVQTAGRTTVAGTLALDAGTPFEIAGGRFQGTGQVIFNGTTGVFNNSDGTLQPGASAGKLTINNGAYEQGAGGSFEFELFGDQAGVTHDLLEVVSNDANIGGALMIILDQAFAPQLQVGDQFEVVRVTDGARNGSLFGQFASISTNFNGWGWTQRVIGDDLFIEVTQIGETTPPNPVPLPAGAWLMLSGLAGLAGVRRLHRRRDR